MTTSKVISRLLYWQPIVFMMLPLRRARCILATRIAIDVLARFAIRAEPRSVVAVVTNAAYERWRAQIQDLPPAAREMIPPPADGWSVWAGAPPDAGPLVDRGGWHGHLCVFVPSQLALLDLDFQAFHRPARGIDAPPVFAAPWPKGAPAISYGMSSRGIFAHYERHEENDAYTQAIDWRSDVPMTVAIVDVIEQAIRRQRRGMSRATAEAELSELARLEARMLALLAQHDEDGQRRLLARIAKKQQLS